MGRFMFFVKFGKFSTLISLYIFSLSWVTYYVCLILSHRSLSLFSLLFILFSLCSSDWIVFIDLPSSSLILFLKKKNFFFCLFRAATMAYGSSQARGQIRATAGGLHHSHSNTGSEPHLQPTPQFMAMLDP